MLPILCIEVRLAARRASSPRPADLVGSRVFGGCVYQNVDLRASPFAKRPVDGDAFAYPGNKFCRDHFEVVFSHHLQGAVVGRERIIKRHFVIVQAEIDAALIGFL